uniref:Uncharacterized protein n=1 Tax=Rhizophagus irregularis (strain DAOM 181602 / DAOM 197198 / MUCL 43194) TaxID=747089 RepID=U9U7I6_RHIID
MSQYIDEALCYDTESEVSSNTEEFEESSIKEIEASSIKEIEESSTEEYIGKCKTPNDL